MKDNKQQLSVYTFTEQKKDRLKFSILVPVYNVEQYLDECIKSVLFQTYHNFELILVDDGSIDSSGKICDQYAKQHKRIRVYHKPNAGQLSAREYALEHANGDYCVFLDSDDYLEKDALEKILATIENTGCDCVVFGMKRVKDGEFISVVQESEERIITDKRELYRKCLFSSDYNPVWRKAVKSNILKGLNYSRYYHIRYGEDKVQSLDILKYSKCVAFIKDALYNYRLNPGGVTQNVKLEKYVDDTVREYALSFLRNEGVFSDLDFEEYRYYCIQSLIKRVYMIAEFGICVEKKVELFENIKRSAYYVDFINKGLYEKRKIGKNYYIYKLFCKKQYRLLIFMLNASRKIKGWLKKCQMR